SRESATRSLPTAPSPEPRTRSRAPWHSPSSERTDEVVGLQRFLPFLLRRPPGLPEERVLLGRSGIARALPTPASLAVLSPEGRPRTAAALGAPVGGGSMLSQAIDAMLNRLSEFLPPPGTP